MIDLCHIKKLPYTKTSFWYSSLLTMIFYSSYSRKLFSYKKIFNNDIEYNNEPLYTYLKEIFNKNSDYIDNHYFSKIFNQIINLNYYNIDDDIIDFIHNEGYYKSFFIHKFFNYLNINHLIIDEYQTNFYIDYLYKNVFDVKQKKFYLGFSENFKLFKNNDKTTYNIILPTDLNSYVSNIKRKLTYSIPEYIIVNIHQDKTLSNIIDKISNEYKTKLNINHFNIEIDGLNTFEKIIIYNGNKYILDSVSFDYESDDSIIGIHCNNKKFIYDNKNNLLSKEWTFTDKNKKSRITMLIYVLYETKRINQISCYSSINNNLFMNHWFNCFLIMIFKSFHSMKLLSYLKPFYSIKKYNDELSVFFTNILKNNKIDNNYKLIDIISLFSYIKKREKLFNYIKKFGYPIHSFLPMFFDNFDIDFLMLDFYKNNFYIGFSENYFYFLDPNNVVYNKLLFDIDKLNNNIEHYSKTLKDKINKDDYIPKYIIINILNDNNNYIDKFNNDYKKKLNFNYYDTKIHGINNFKNIIIFKGRKYILDSVSVNNDTDKENNDKINRITNSIIGINCNNEKYIYNGLIGSNKKLPCKLINYKWNIKNKKYFTIDTKKCSIVTTTKNNKDTNNYSFNNGFRILVYVLLIEDDKYENDSYNYLSSLDMSINKSISSIKKADIGLSPMSIKKKSLGLSPMSSIKKKSLGLSPMSSIKKKSLVLSPISSIKKKSLVLSPISSFKDKNKCPEDKIYNPKTKRCVSKTGKIGLKLLMNQK